MIVSETRYCVWSKNYKADMIQSNTKKSLSLSPIFFFYFDFISSVRCNLRKVEVFLLDIVWSVDDR